MKKIALVLAIILVFSVALLQYFSSSYYTWEILLGQAQLRLRVLFSSLDDPADVVFLHAYYVSIRDFERALMHATGRHYEVLQEALPDIQTLLDRNDIRERLIKYDPISVTKIAENQVIVKANFWIQMIQGEQSRVDLETIIAYLAREGNQWKVERILLEDRSVQFL